MANATDSVKVQWHGKEFSSSGATFIAPANSSPRMYSTISWSMKRDSESSSKIHVTLNGNLWRLWASGLGYNVRDPLTGNYGTNVKNSDWTAYYGYHIKLYVSIGGIEKQIVNKGASPSTWTSSKSEGEITFDLDWPKNDNIPIVFRADAGCYIKAENWCSSGNFSKQIATVTPPKYNSETKPTNVSTGVVHTTNNKDNGNQTSISDRPDMKIWFSWSGEKSGSPDKNKIDSYNIDINAKEKNPDGATSIDITQGYTKNKELSLFTIAESYGAKIGTTLYCYVNTHTPAGWLGKVYLGSVKLTKRGYVYFKDSSGNKKECTMSYAKDSGGTKRTGRYVQVKDSGGTTRIIDLYTTLYD